MRTTWRVKKVTATEGSTIAELVRVEWFKVNPAYTAMMDEYNDLIERLGRYEADRIVNEREDQWVDEWLPDVQPGEEDAEFFEPGLDCMSIDITGGLDLKPGQDVVMVLDAFMVDA